MDYPKRLIEVDLPIKRISAHARREKSIRHGHISTLHIWWARRPLAACRAVICAALWPDPADEKCPPEFREEARRLMTDWATNHLDLTSPESMSRFNRIKNNPKVLADSIELRKTLLDFIADFANWDNSVQPSYLDLSRTLTQRAHEALGGAPGTKPLVVDPFAGGGAIPLEGLRVGADVFASDLNPVAVLLNRVMLEYIPKHGQDLAEDLRQWGTWVKTNARSELADYYPSDPDGATPIAYLWARTIRCEGPGCGVTVPLLRSLWLAKKPNRSVALRLLPRPKDNRLDLEIIVKERGSWISQTVPDNKIPNPTFDGTVKRGSATCPCCGYTTPLKRVREQLISRNGGAHDARLLAVVTTREGEQGRRYRLANAKDIAVVERAAVAVSKAKSLRDGDISFIPDEPTPKGGGQGAGRGLSHTGYAMDRVCDMHTPRQTLALATLAKEIRNLPKEAAADAVRRNVISTLLAFALGRTQDLCGSLATWANTLEAVCGSNRAQNRMPIVWDFVEAVPISGAGGDFAGQVDWVARVVDHCVAAGYKYGTSERALAQANPLPTDAADAVVTDPPYYDAFAYSDLSDFFLAWLRRSVPKQVLAYDHTQSPKEREIVVYGKGTPGFRENYDEVYFHQEMTCAFADARRVAKPDAIAVVVFANKTTVGWEALLGSLVAAGWTITASWPIDTERPVRQRAQDSAALASSVHLICRPRENASGEQLNTVGEWRDVLGELPHRIHEWMPRLASDGVVGADAIFACLGAALEIFSRYRCVEKANGEAATLREYLEHVWAAVSTEALSMIFRDADAAGLESDARFTAIVLWTLGAAGSVSADLGDAEPEDATDQDDEDDSPKGKSAKGGYTLEYDAARKIAQGLGVNLEQIDSVVEVKGDKARLLPVSERAASLFGKVEKAEAATKKRGKKATQKKLFDKDTEEGGVKTETVTLGDAAAAAPGVTALDRVHQAMLLFADGRADALKRFIVEDGVGGDARFWKLAQSLSALYPAGSDEKRWVDGVLARKKSFGF